MNQYEAPSLAAAGVMKVLIASSDATLRRRFANWLVSAHHTAVEAEAASSACAALDGKPDVVIVDWMLAGGGAPLIKYMRGLDPRQHHYVIAICMRPQPSDIAAFVAAGADDFAPASASREEVIARVEALARIRGWTAKLTQVRAIAFGETLDLDGLRVWREIDSIVATEVGEMLGATLRPEPRSDGAIQWCGSVPLTLSADHVELLLGVGIAADANERFARDVLGTMAGEAAIGDALREIANVAGGAVKRAALGDGLAMTIGLPTGDDVFAVASARRWAATTPSGLQLTFAIAATPSHVRLVRRCELREGMVLASDIHNAGGVLLVAAGTCLTSTTVERLERFLDVNERVEVSSTRAPLARSA
jgi:CheY-like chemotaxis protein